MKYVRIEWRPSERLVAGLPGHCSCRLSPSPGLSACSVGWFVSLLVHKEVLLTGLCERKILFQLEIYDRLRQAKAKRTGYPSGQRQHCCMIGSSYCVISCAMKTVPRSRTDARAIPISTRRAQILSFSSPTRLRRA